MQRWKAYMESTKADRRPTEALPFGERQVPLPESPGPDEIGAPWFPDCEPWPRAT
jgi:hypothetical protein